MGVPVHSVFHRPPTPVFGNVPRPIFRAKQCRFLGQYLSDVQRYIFRPKCLFRGLILLSSCSFCSCFFCSCSCFFCSCSFCSFPFVLVLFLAIFLLSCFAYTKLMTVRIVHANKEVHAWTLSLRTFAADFLKSDYAKKNRSR